jgi:parallel beta-helix repeat protein
MYKDLFRKVFAFSIVIILIGTCVITSTGALIEKKNYSFPIKINSDGKTLYVGGSGADNYSKIQDAIDNASNGDKVFVYGESSPYYENIIVDKSIIIIGEHPTITIIDGNTKQCTINVNANNVNISGFHIINGNLSGLKLLNSEDCYIFNNIIEFNSRYGISLIESSNNLIEINTIINNENGIKLSSNSNNNIINENKIDKNYNGIFLESSKDNLLTTNEIMNNEFGIKLYSKSRKNIIELNSISQNTLGIFLGGTIYPTFVFNILLDGSTHNKITKNNFIENTQDAFFQNSRRNRWWRNYWNESKILPKLIFGELFICRLQGIPPTAVEHHIPWVPRIDWRPALRPFSIQDT